MKAILARREIWLEAVGLIVLIAGAVELFAGYSIPTAALTAVLGLVISVGSLFIRRQDERKQ